MSGHVEVSGLVRTGSGESSCAKTLKRIILFGNVEVIGLVWTRWGEWSWPDTLGLVVLYGHVEVNVVLFLTC